MNFQEFILSFLLDFSPCSELTLRTYQVESFSIFFGRVHVILILISQIIKDCIGNLKFCSQATPRQEIFFYWNQGGLIPVTLFSPPQLFIGDLIIATFSILFPFPDLAFFPFPPRFRPVRSSLSNFKATSQHFSAAVPLHIRRRAIFCFQNNHKAFTTIFSPTFTSIFL